MGQQGPVGAKRCLFSKMILDNVQLFLDRFELVVAHFGPPKIPKCLENGLFWDQKWVKNGSKAHFSKPHPRPYGVHKRVK